MTYELDADICCADWLACVIFEK